MKRRELLKAASLFPFLGLKNLASQDENKPVPQNLYTPQESIDDFKNWSVDYMDAVTRKEIYNPSKTT